MAVSLISYDDPDAIIELNTSELNNLAIVVLEYMASLPSVAGSISPGTSNPIGVFTDTALGGGVSSANVTILSNTYTLSQVTTPQIVGEDPPYYFGLDTTTLANTVILRENKTTIDDLATYILNFAVTNEGPTSYSFGTTSPNDGGVWINMGTLVDTLQNFTVVQTQYNLWKKISHGTTTSYNKPLKLDPVTGDMKEFSTEEIQRIAKIVEQKIVSTGIGFYTLQSSSPTTGVWKSTGTLLDTRRRTTQVAYIGPSNVGTYTGVTPAPYAGVTPAPYAGVTPATYNGITPTIRFGTIPTISYGVTPALFNGSFQQTYTGTTPTIRFGTVPSISYGVTPASFNGSFQQTYNGVTPASFNGSYQQQYNGTIPTIRFGTTPTIRFGTTPTISYQSFAGLFVGFIPTISYGTIPTISFGTSVGLYAGSRDRFRTGYLNGYPLWYTPQGFLRGATPYGTWTSTWFGYYIGYIPVNYFGVTPATFTGSTFQNYIGYFTGTFTGVTPATFTGVRPATFTGVNPTISFGTVPTVRFGTVPSISFGTVPTTFAGVTPATFTGQTPATFTSNVPTISFGTVPTTFAGVTPITYTGVTPATFTGQTFTPYIGVTPATYAGVTPATYVGVTPTISYGTGLVTYYGTTPATFSGITPTISYGPSNIYYGTTPTISYGTTSTGRQVLWNNPSIPLPYYGVVVSPNNDLVQPITLWRRVA